MQEFAITNDKTKRPVVLRTKTLADLLECMLTGFLTITFKKKRLSRSCADLRYKVQILIPLFLLCLTSISDTFLLSVFYFAFSPQTLQK